MEEPPEMTKFVLAKLIEFGLEHLDKGVFIRWAVDEYGKHLQIGPLEDLDLEKFKKETII